MKKLTVAVLVLALLLIGSVVSAQKEDEAQASDDLAWGLSFECGQVEVNNAAGFRIVQQRPGNSYRITAVGINGFDPVLFVADEAGNSLCSDDEPEASYYVASLPTTGEIEASTTTSQVVYNLRGNDFADVIVAVGGYNNQGGEFIIIVEDMYSQAADGIGDPFSLLVTPAMVESSVFPTAYMISVVGSFDPLMLVVNEDYEVVEDAEGNVIGCDDAGNENLCWGESESLSGYGVSRSGDRLLGGGSLDSMLTIPIDEASAGGYINFVMSNYESEGDYVAVFHLGTSEMP